MSLGEFGECADVIVSSPFGFLTLVVNFGFWALVADFGIWTLVADLDFKHQWLILDSRHWLLILDFGHLWPFFWNLDAIFWILDFGSKSSILDLDVSVQCLFGL